MATAQITRSRGVHVAGFNPGGGYQGATPELDSIVASAAEALRARYSRDVEIRFNSDRQSGGAFMACPGSVGITANRRHLPTLRKLFDRAYREEGETWESYCAEQRLDPTGPEFQIKMSVYIDGPNLTDPAAANCDNGRGGGYAYLPAAGLADALAIMAANFSA